MTTQNVHTQSPAALAASFAYCREVTRSRAKNFYYAFRLLDAARRDAICTIYAFMRHCDDLSDEPGATRAPLEDWRKQMVDALAGNTADHPVWLGFAETAHRYRIPHQYFHDMIDGVSSDLDRRRFETFEELYRYCYQVASVAGLSLIHIFGYRGEQALDLAEKCGIAFQITNILRDVREDALIGRTYLPQEDLRRFGVSEQLLLDGAESEPFRELMRFEARRARGYYEQSRPLVGMVDPSCRKSLAALIEIYSNLLTRIEQRDYNVLRQRIRLSSAEKSWILVKSLWSSY